MLMTDEVVALPAQSWDERVIVCRYELDHDGMRMAMHVFIVVTSNFVVVVDTLINGQTGANLAQIARERLEHRQLLVVNTHADYDHAWGNMAFAEPGAAFAPIFGTRRCVERMRSAAELAALRERQQHDPTQYRDVRLVPPTISFDASLTIDGGDLSIVLLPTPGHTTDHCSIWIPEISTLLAGDAAEQPFPFVDASVAQLRASLARLEALTPDVALYCHADLASGPALLAQNSAYFEEVEHRCRAAVRAGARVRSSGADVEALIGFPMQDALPRGLPVSHPEFYREAHRAAIRATLAELAR
jgi:glyoxylase-like metal-dependent hydrolase (beta-lactamase superfamily II)